MDGSKICTEGWKKKFAQLALYNKKLLQEYREMEEMRVIKLFEKDPQYEYTSWQRNLHQDAFVYQEGNLETNATLFFNERYFNNQQRSQNNVNSIARLITNNNDFPLTSNTTGYAGWTCVDYILENYDINRSVAQYLVELFEVNTTIPFITHYRRDVIGEMDVDTLKDIKISHEYAIEIKQKANNLIKELKRNNKWTPVIDNYIESVKSLEELEHVESAFSRQLNDELDNCEIDEYGYALIADKINKDVSTFIEIKRLLALYPPKIRTYRNNIQLDDVGEELEKSCHRTKSIMDIDYEDYDDFSACVTSLNSYAVMEINHGESSKRLSVEVDIEISFLDEFEEHCVKQYDEFLKSDHDAWELLANAIQYLWENFMAEFISKQTRSSLTRKAQYFLTKQYGKSIKSLFLMAPVKNKVVMGIEPGIDNIGCKVVVLSEDQEVLEAVKIFPFFNNCLNAEKAAHRILADFILTHKCSVVALGENDACRKAEFFLSRVIKTVSKFIKVRYMIIEMFGIKSCERKASEELPYVDTMFLPAICIARRMMDPMREWANIERRKLYYNQIYNLPAYLLDKRVDEAITEAVSAVGVDVNTAPISLLRRVSGLNKYKATSIINRRESKGPFTSRNELLCAPEISAYTFQQCAGFLIINPETQLVLKHQHDDTKNFNYLSQTLVHPECYPVAYALMKQFFCDPSEIGTKKFIDGIKAAHGQLDEFAKFFNCDVKIIESVLEALSVEKGKDVRGTMDESMLRTGPTIWTNLFNDSMCNGVIKTITNFCTYVDIGAEVYAVLCGNKSTKYLKQSLYIGQWVEVKIINLVPRSRIEVELIKCL